MKSLLVIDDEQKIRDVIRSYFQKEKFQTIGASTGKEAIALVERQHFDMIILDLMLPDIPGEEICMSIRRKSSTPILMLTAKVQENDKLHGLAIGADDYMVKPFSPRELVMRVKTILRRSSDEFLLADIISFNDGELTIDSAEQKVTVRGKKVNLTPNEYKLLLVLAKFPKRIYSEEQLVEKVLGYDFEGDERVIDQHVKNIRHKIEENPKDSVYIVTVFGTGYKFMGERP
ncbi:response regulator transcription factor [Peribacillus sp. SCS-155]|uniref:response regulator transcription factor n=1 Tax=Peribacillus sedimenti TaxID=3115297 RepID=UPI00390622DC